MLDKTFGLFRKIRSAMKCSLFYYCQILLGNGTGEANNLIRWWHGTHAGAECHIVQGRWMNNNRNKFPILPTIALYHYVFPDLFPIYKRMGFFWTGKVLPAEEYVCVECEKNHCFLWNCPPLPRNYSRGEDDQRGTNGHYHAEEIAGISN